MNTYFIRTFGCQMNKHDAERVAGLLEAEGMDSADDPEAADAIVFMTCCVRDNADNRFFGQLSSLRELKTRKPEVLIAVGGCIGQRDGLSIVDRFEHVDVVFGTHNVGRLPHLLDMASFSVNPVVEVLQSSDDFASDLPARREHSYHAWVPIATGCDNHCAYCIVPAVRGNEKSRTEASILREIERLLQDGVMEVALLGQNVNSWGRDLYGAPRFHVLLDKISQMGVPRVRFTTSHPKDLSNNTIEAMASTDAICNALHLPVQSGSNQVLGAMNRGYTSEQYLDVVHRLYERIPGLALSTDVIVGFPGETDSDFQATLDLVETCRFDQAFSFMYSPREGTPAYGIDNQIPREVMQERFDALIPVIHSSALTKNKELIETNQLVLVEGRSRRDPLMLSGRTEGNKVVHAPLSDTLSIEDMVGKLAEVLISDARTWHLTGRIISTEPVSTSSVDSSINASAADRTLDSPFNRS